MDPDAMKNMMGEAMKNPEMMNMMGNLMKNPEMMKGLMSMASGMMGGVPDGTNKPFNTNTKEDVKRNMKNPDLNSMMNNPAFKTMFNPELKFKKDDIIVTINLKSEKYNNKQGIVKEYLSEKKRYDIFIEELNESIAIKEINMVVKVQDNLEEELNLDGIDLED
jgi:hypothetical protein